MTTWEVVAILDHAADHIVDSCSQLDDPWSDSYNDATELLKGLASKARKFAHRTARQ